MVEGIYVPTTVVRSLAVLIFCAACAMVTIPGVGAEETGHTWFGTGGVFEHFSTPPPVLPAFAADSSLPPASYTRDGCPIGTDGAPYLINPLLTSGAKCRGACGPDCPFGRCQKQPMKILENREGTGTCMYTGVISCPTHPGCQQHDACYDYCEESGYTFIMDMCHRMCNERCADEYGTLTCIPWADITGNLYGPAATVVADWMLSPDYTGTISFSDYPEFTAYETPRPTSPPTPSPTPSATPPPPTTLPATTPSPTGTFGPDARLTIIMTGDLTAEDLEGTTVGWSVEALSESCSPTARGAQCVLKFRYGTPVDLSVYPASGVRFTGWSGSCSGSGDCLVSMTGDKTVTALFSRTTAATPVIHYQDYCTDNYPGSVYDPETGSCVFSSLTPTLTVTYGGTGSDLVLIPLAGGCCPGEPCTTQVATAAGGTPPYTFTSGSLAAGSTPPMGMIIDMNGYLTGTAPPEMRTYRFSICVKDMAGLSRCGESTVVVS